MLFLMKLMPRLTKTEIDAEIIDRAAGLFAKHGFEHTSLQQIADAVKYSKAGLLHHYPSKKAIYDQVLITCLDQMRALLAKVDGIPVGRERDLAVVETSVQLSFDWPGISAFTNRLADNGEGTTPEMTQMGMMMYEALGIDLAALNLERLIRVTSAFSGLGVSAMIAARLDFKREWRPSIVQAAMDALGHAKAS